MTKQKREKSVKVRFSEGELTQAKANCPRAELARWLRELSLNQTGENTTVVTSPVATIDPNFLRHFAAIGNNINQLTKKVNSQYSGMDAINILSKLAVIEEQISEILTGVS